MMNHEDWLAAIEAGFDVGFQTPPEELPSRDTWENGDERHQAFVIGLDNGQRARIEADAREAEQRETWDNYVRPVIAATVADMNRGTPEQQKAIRLARGEELAAANRAASIPWAEPVATKPAPEPAQQGARFREQAREHTPYVSQRPRRSSREMSR